jgi:hypothetical protein
MVIPAGGTVRPSRVAAFLAPYPHVKIVMVAGNRESKAPGIGARVEHFLGEVFRRLGHGGAPVDPSD